MSCKEENTNDVVKKEQDEEEENNISFLYFDPNKVPSLEVGDMVKISQRIKKPYCHNKKKYIQTSTESFWCEIKDIKNNGEDLMVMVSNYCTLSSSEKEPPFQFGEKLLIDKTFIKEHKKNISKLETNEYIKNITEIIKIIHTLPNDEKNKILQMSMNEKLRYINQNYMIKNVNKN